MKTVRLEKITKITSGFAFKSDAFSDSHGIPIARIRDVKRGYTETYYSGEYDPTYIIKNGDILIGMDGEFNTEKWRGGRALLNQRVCKIEADESKLNQDYLYYFLPKSLKKIENQTPSVTVKHLSVAKIKDIEIPLPRIFEQKRIAAILDKADAIRRKRRQALEFAIIQFFITDPAISRPADGQTHRTLPGNRARTLGKKARYIRGFFQVTRMAESRHQ